MQPFFSLIWLVKFISNGGFRCEVFLVFDNELFLASNAQSDGIATSTRLVSIQTYQTADIKIAVRGFADELATIATEVMEV